MSTETRKQNAGGPTVFGALLDAGLLDVRTTGRWESWTGGGPGAQFVAGVIDQVHDRLLAAGLTAAHLDRVRALLADPGFVLSGHTLVSTSGRRPHGRQP